jgi:hypothetical protein
VGGTGGWGKLGDEEVPICALSHAQLRPPNETRRGRSGDGEERSIQMPSRSKVLRAGPRTLLLSAQGGTLVVAALNRAERKVGTNGLVPTIS